MKGDNTKEIKVYKSIKYDNITSLVRAAYILGQIKGLERKLLTHPETIKDREFLVSLIINDHLLK